MNFQCICLRSDNKQSEISQRKPVISKANKFILEFKNAHNNLPGNAESKRKKTYHKLQDFSSKEQGSKELNITKSSK